MSSPARCPTKSFPACGLTTFFEADSIIVVIGLLADKILFSPWERFLHRRWGTLKS
jgi:hypothetical protein